MWGGGGNSGVSGQVIRRTEADECTIGRGGPINSSGDSFVFSTGQVRVAVEQWCRDDAARGGEVDLTGDLVWPTATIFCRYLCERAVALNLGGRRVLDLGAGTGLVGLVAAALGAEATFTDVPRVFPLLASNVAVAAAVAAATPSALSGVNSSASSVAQVLW